jgi:SAM-dependent methyltransferase
MNQEVRTPRTADGVVDHNAGWRLWSSMVRYYPSGVHRRRLIEDWAAPLRPATLLDVGCGPGILIEQLRRRMPQARFCGADNADATVAENRERLPGSRWCVLDITRERLDERFDVVVCSEVLEHTLDDEAALANLVAMTGGHLLITVPTGRLYPLEAGFGHLRHYDKNELCARIERHGLRIVRAEAWGFPFMNLFKRATNLRPQATLDSFGAGEWSWTKKALGAALTGLFYINLPKRGPQLLLLAAR